MEDSSSISIDTQNTSGKRNSLSTQGDHQLSDHDSKTETLGLGIDTPTTDTNPWGDSATPSASTTSLTTPTKETSDDFHIKPIRLMKRQQDKRASVSSASSLTLPPHSPSTHRSPSASKTKSEEFQCRPIRLGSSCRKRDSRVSLGRHESDASSSNSQEGPTSNGGIPGFGVVASGTATSISSSSSTTSTPVQETRPIQIKNLPISQQPASHASQRNKDTSSDMIFAVGLVDFHHQRGPEVSWWKSNYHTEFTDGLFKNLSFQALPDGSHLFEETFSNFNLVYDFKSGTSIDDLEDLNQFQGDPRDLKTLFGCSCVRQVKTSDLSKEELERNKDFTRSIVQKAVIIIVRKQPIFNKIKEKLSIITRSYFQQDDFHNVTLLEDLFENLNSNFKLVDDELEELETKSVLATEISDTKDEEEFFVNLNLKDSILKFKHNFLTIFKSLLLDKKIIIFSNNNLDMLTQFQNNLISLIPNLINNLDNSGCPLIDYIETNGPLAKPNSLNTNNRKSMLRFFGLPLQIFNTKSSFWNPYLPLQQLNELSVESYMIGCSNLLFLNQAEKFKVDLVVNLDTNELIYPKTNSKPEDLVISYSDKKFITNLISNMNSPSDEFIGNDDYIRYQFEDYLTSLVATTRFAQYCDKFSQPPPGFTTGDQPGVGDLSLFNNKFIESWKQSNNYKIWNMMADEFIFNFAEPKHLGVEISDANQAYKNISNFFNNFKFKPVAGEDHSVENKAQKFIPEEEDKNSVQTSASENYSHNKNSSASTNGSEVKIEGSDEPYEKVDGNDLSTVGKKISTWTSAWSWKK